MIIKTKDEDKKKAIRITVASYGIEYKEVRKDIYGINIEPELEEEFKEKLTRRLRVKIYSMHLCKRR